MLNLVAFLDGVGDLLHTTAARDPMLASGKSETLETPHGSQLLTESPCACIHKDMQRD